MNCQSRYLVTFCLVVPLLFSGCGFRKGPDVNAKVEDVVTHESGAKQEIRAINERLFASVTGAPSPQDYVLGEGDFLQVSVFEAPELKTEGRVSARGFMTLPLIGTIEVKGLTTRQAEQKIETTYGSKYLLNPHVNVFVKEQVSGKLTLMGAVKKPGNHPYLSRQNLLQALALGEGLSEHAGKMVQVRRSGDDPAHPTTYLIDLDEVVRGSGELNIEIKSGDVIYVPEAGTIYVDGAVRKPGNYPIKQKMTVPEVIVAAGGFSGYADESNIKLVRPKGVGQNPDVVNLSFKDLQLAHNQTVEVKDRDIIFVETNKIEAMIYGLRITGLGGMVGVGWEPPRQ